MDRNSELQITAVPASRPRNSGRVIAATSAMAVLLFAGTAQAGREFKSGFEHEMGHITAQHIAAITHLFFIGLHTRPHVVHQHFNGCGHAHHRAAPVHRYRHHDRHYRGHQLGRNDHRQQRHDRDSRRQPQRRRSHYRGHS